ncbi:MAG: hypothetical protein NC333_05150, partial [Terasakiella sp.]|nr:hypothetical protein [Terasakiella sp.]
DGSAVAVLALGPVVADALKAAADTDAAVYDMIYAKPLDEDILAEVAAKGCPIVTVEDAAASGGMGSAVAEWMAARGHAATVTRLGIPDDFVTHGTPAQLRHICGYDTEGIARAISQAISK